MIWKDWCGRKDKKGWTSGKIKKGGGDTNTVIPTQPPVLPILPLQPILRIHSGDGSLPERLARAKTANAESAGERTQAEQFEQRHIACRLWQATTIGRVVLSARSDRPVRRRIAAAVLQPRVARVCGGGLRPRHPRCCRGCSGRRRRRLTSG